MTALAGEPQGAAGVVEIAVVVVSLGPRAPMVAVEVAGLLIVAPHLALLQAPHLPDEVDGQVLTLTVHRLTPGTSAAGGGCRGAAAQTQHDGEEKCLRQHFVLSLLVRLSRATEDCLSEFSL